MNLRLLATAWLAALSLGAGGCCGTLHDAVHLPPGEPDLEAPEEPHRPWEPEPGAPTPRELPESGPAAPSGRLTPAPVPATLNR